MKEPLRTDEKLLNSKEVGLLLHCSKDYVSRLCREGKLTCQREGQAWFVESDSAMAFADTMRQDKQRKQQELAKIRRQEYKNGRVAPTAKKDILSPYTAESFKHRPAVAALAVGTLALVLFFGNAATAAKPVATEVTASAVVAEMPMATVNLVENTAQRTNTLFNDVAAFYLRTTADLFASSAAVIAAIAASR